ncbi:MAG TPA: S8 family serine peptidase [Terrimesophilobacter sp.]|nr:S8 family serine peptidase [Terrimesophilobacter sp.]
MADHPRLPEPRPLDTRRRPPVPSERELTDRSHHATTLAGVLAGLGLPYPGAIDQPSDDEELVDSRLVLVFTNKGAPLQDGPFRKWNMVPVAEGSDRTYMVISDIESRRLFARLVETYGGDPDAWADPKAWQEQLDSIEGVRLYAREDRADARLQELSFNGTEVIDVLLWPSTLETMRNRARIARNRLDEIHNVVQGAGGRNPAIRVVAEDPRSDSTMVRVVVDQQLLDDLLDHPVVERVRPPLRPEVTIGDLIQASPMSAVPAPTGEPVGVIDDLVTNNTLLDGVVRGRAAFPEGRVFGAATAHGTHVAGVAAYGELRSFASNPQSGLPVARPIFSARVMEQDPASVGRAVIPGLFHEQLEKAIRWLHSQGVRIITCSITDDGPDLAPTPSETMTTIDKLVRELGVVVVISAGNASSVDPLHWRDDYPGYLDRDESRVADPAGAALAVTVGARAQYDVPSPPSQGPSSRVAIAQQGQASPFTRTGPTRGRGSSGMAKPEFSAHGGNYSWDQLTGQARGKDPNMSVITLAPAGAPGGQILAVDDGTSLSAPFVAHQVATIATRYPSASSNLLRALAALAGDRSAVDRQSGAILSVYGEPLAARVLDSDTHRVIVVYEGAIAANSTVIHEIPVPQAFATGAYGQRMRVALAFDPPVRRSRRDYIAGAMSFDFVRNLPVDEVAAVYSAQPSRADVEQDPALNRRDLPAGRRRPSLNPSSQTLLSNTLLCRTFSGAWDPDDEGYFLVVKHQARPWANAEEREDQKYAVAVELSLTNEAKVNLLAQVQAQLQQRARLRFG